MLKFNNMKLTPILLLLLLSCAEKQPEPQLKEIKKSVAVTFLDNTKDTITLTMSAIDEPYFDITQHRYGSVLNVIYHSGKNWDGTNVTKINTIATNVKMFEELPDRMGVIRIAPCESVEFDMIYDSIDTVTFVSPGWSYEPWEP